MSWLNGQIKRKNQAGFDVVRGLKPQDESGARAVGAVMSLAFGGLMMYVAAFYMGSFINVGKIIDTNSTVISLDADNSTTEDVIKRIIGGRENKRVYLRAGQAIQAEYSLPDNAVLNLHIAKCAHMPVLEVFTCDIVGDETITVRNRSNGSNKITVGEPGFYYFTNTVTVTAQTDLKRNKDYTVIWRRA